MSRIIAGTAGGLRLASVPGENTRPTTDRVKESLFSKLESYDVVQGARVLDAYAGSGALGCEALSRGAASVEFVEKHPKACEITRRNVAATSKAATGVTRVTQGSAQSYVAVHSGPWDLVFLDPPYAFTQDQILDILRVIAPNLAEGAIVVVERSSRDAEPAWNSQLRRFAMKKYGETVLYYLEPDESYTDTGSEPAESENASC